MSVNSVIPPYPVSDSIQIGMPTTTTFLQAVDGGLDLVAVAGLNFTRKKDVDFGVVTRNGVNITKPQDLIGKKVGVPGLNTFLARDVPRVDQGQWHRPQAGAISLRRHSRR